MEREQSKFYLQSPIVEEQVKDSPARKFSWSTESHLQYQREYTFDEGGHRTKRRNSEESTHSSSKRINKTHVPSACANCKKAHLACDVSRPCKRCIAMGKTDTCIDIQHKKRGRPKIKDRKSDSYLQDSNYSQIIHLTPTLTPGTVHTRVNTPTSASTPTPTPTPIPIPNLIPLYPPQTEHQSTSTSSTCSTPSNNASYAIHRGMGHPKPPEICMDTANYSNHAQSSSAPICPLPGQSSSEPIRPSPSRSSLSLAPQQSTDEPSQSLHLNLYDPSKTEGQDPQGTFTPRPSDSGDFIMILNFKMDCAMISEEYHELLGYTSQDLVDHSLYDIVHITDTDRIENLKSQLIDHVVKVVTQYQGSFLAAPLREGFGCSLSIGDIQKQTYANLINSASGSEDFTEAIHIRRKDGGYELFNVQMRVGGAFGTDLTSIDTYDKAYVICKLAKFQLPSLSLNTHNY